MQREGGAARRGVVHDAMVGYARHLDHEGIALDLDAIPFQRHDERLLLRPGAGRRHQQRKHRTKVSSLHSWGRATPVARLLLSMIAPLEWRAPSKETVHLPARPVPNLALACSGV